MYALGHLVQRCAYSYCDCEFNGIVYTDYCLLIYPIGLFDGFTGMPDIPGFTAEGAFVPDVSLR